MGAIEDADTRDPRRTGPSPGALIEVAKCLASEAPLLLIVDELGKSLEAIRDRAGADPYLLQQLAECGQSGAGLPIFLLTLQHLSFEDYLGSSDNAQRREWAKVQGRFEDVAYVESPAQTRALIRTAFKVEDPVLEGRINSWAEELTGAMRSLGSADLAKPKGISSCYPLHPLAAMVLPELCSRYGQHERTLFSFLTGPGSATASSFLTSKGVKADEPLPSVGLATIYDYFVANGMGTHRSSRWTEIAIRIRDYHGLTPAQDRLVKAIALLNLVSTSGTLRASRPVLALTDSNVEETLASLEEAGIVTYRDFADEYRIWQGTDVDIRSLLNSARQQVEQPPLVEVLSNIHDPSPVVAARHSAEHQTLRVFKRRYASGAEVVEPLSVFSDYDGEILLVVDDHLHRPTISHAKAHLAKPVVAALDADLTCLEETAREVAAIKLALEDAVIADDWVARQELGERLAQTQILLDEALTNSFEAGNCQWTLLESDNKYTELTGRRGSAPLSKAADFAYPDTPLVRNEMLNRTTLTSQGAKARRMLLEAMINHGHTPKLGLSGSGPEVAMYRAFLEWTGLHCYDRRNQTMTFRSPNRQSGLGPAWAVLTAEFNRAKTRRINMRDIHAVLLSPPIGMKAAVLPVFVTAGLIAHSDEIAIYEHGTFKPLLTSEVSQRMVRNPAHFEIKHFANTTGGRRQVINELASRLHVKPRFGKHRVGNVLAIVGHLVTQIRNLNNYVYRTANLTKPTIAARDGLLAAVEPDDLLFVTLPEALGFPTVSANIKTYPEAYRYAAGIGAFVDEVTTAYEQLLERLLQLLFSATAEKSRIAIIGQAASLADEVLDPRVRSFVLTLANEHLDSDTDWIQAIATVVAQKAPTEWRDVDVRRFEHELPQQVAAFRRLVALHAQHRADGGGPFQAFKVTFTRPDGKEDVRLVSVEQRERDQIAEVLNSAINDLTVIAGSTQRAQEALLALLGERLLPSAQKTEEKPVITPRWIQHG